jgi:MipA family protein
MSSLKQQRIRFSSVATISVACQAMACTAVLVISPPATAQQRNPDGPHGLSGSIGIGAVATTTYEGSPNRRTLVGLDISVSYRSKEWGTVELGQRGLVWQAYEAGGFKLGLAAGIDPGRKTKRSSTVDPIPGDKRLAGMGDVRASPEAGFLIGYGPISVLAHKSVGDRGHKGAQVDLTAGFPLELSDTVGVRFGAGLTWADKRYMQAYFGVTPAQALSTGFPAYAPRAGLRKFEASVGAEYAFANDWKLQGTLVFTRLTGDAEDSPLVARKSSPSASVGVAYAF